MSAPKALAAEAFNALEQSLLGKPRVTLKQFLEYERLPVNPPPAPLFVTWTKKGRLRGCIGTFSAEHTLESGIRRYAKIAAFEDSRFPPITASEIPSLAVCVTLLGPLEPIGSYNDWQIGLHGVRAEFPGGYSSVYLPEVAQEQGWDHAETIESLADKAGAPSTNGVKLWRYEGKKSRLAYEEYVTLLREVTTT